MISFLSLESIHETYDMILSRKHMIMKTLNAIPMLCQMPYPWGSFPISPGTYFLGCA